MKPLILNLLFSIIFVTEVYCQEYFNDPEIYNGTVILDDRSTMKGKFTYHQTSETLKFENGTRITAEKALYFQFYDHNESYNRFFFSLKSEDGNVRFYEIILNGAIPLFRKSILVNRDYIDSKNAGTKIYLNKSVVEFQLYLNNNDSLVEITDFASQLLPLMKNRIKDISSYILLEQLDVNTPSDQLKIIDYYNDLSVEK